MRDHHRRLSLPRLATALPVVLAAALVAGCQGGTGGTSTVPASTPDGSAAAPTTPGTSASASAPAATASAGTVPTEVPGGASAGAPATVTPTTATDWGPIFDALPADFPRFPGSEAGEPSEGPASAVFTVPAEAGVVAEWYQGALERATYSTLSMSGPLEDGSIVLESAGEGECRIQTTLRPASGSTMVTVLYGAGCPAPAG